MMRPASLTAILVAMLLTLIVAPRPAAAQGRITLKRPVTLTLVPPGEIRADGSTQLLALIVTDENGQLASTGSFRGSRVDMGRLGEFLPIGPGVWTVEYTAPAVSEPYSAQLQLKVKVGKQSAAATFPLAIAPADSLRFTMQATPDALVLGTHQASTLVFSAIDGAGQPVDGLELAVRASIGTAGDVQVLGNGAYVVQYTPPATQKTPALATIAVVDLARPETAFGFFPLPLVGAVSWPMDTGAPLTVVAMKVGEREFGPVAADANGLATVPIEVPPGVATAMAYAFDAEGNPTSPVQVDLRLRPYKRLVIAQPAAEYPGDGALAMPIYLFVVDELGQPMTADPPLQIDATGGAFTALNRVAPGVFQAVFVPPAVAVATPVTMTAWLIGGEAEGKESVAFTVVPAHPAAFRFTTDPPLVDGGARAVTLRGQVLGGEAGLPAGTAVGFTGPDGVIPMEVALADGVFEATLNANFDGPVALSAEVLLPATERPVAGLVAWPVMDQVAVNDSTTIVAMALDRFGLPVSGVELSGVAVNNIGTVTGGGATDHHGRTSFQYTATPLTGPALVAIGDGSHTFTVPLWQAEPLLIGLQLPLQGGAGQLARMRSWGGLRGRLLLGRGTPPPPEIAAAGGAPAPAAGTPAAAAAPAADTTPWGGAATSAGAGPTAAWAEQVRGLLASGEAEARALRGVQISPVAGEMYDIVVHYSHAASVVSVAGQQIMLSKEEWFAGWASLIGQYSQGSSFSSRDFVLIDDDSGKGLALSTTDCRGLAKLSQAKRVEYVTSRAQTR
jgi:hypothetical protein